MKLARSLLLAVAGAVSGCATTTMPLSVHPTPASRDSAGLSFGAAYGRESQNGMETSVLQVPYAEGVLRKSLGTGQLELRATGSMGYAGFNLELAPGSSVSVLLEPGLGMSYQRNFNSNSGNGDEPWQLALVPSASVVFTFERGVYVAPRVSYGFVSSSSSNSDNYALGAVLGYTTDARPFSYGIELSVVRLADISDKGTLGSPVWIVMPSVAVQLVGN